MPRPPKPLVAALTLRLQAALTATANRSASRLQTMFDGLDAYDEDQIRGLTRTATPLVTGAKSVAVSHAVAFYAFTAGIRPPAINANDVPVTANLRDPFISVWSALANGAPYADAVTAGRNRCDAVVRDLVTSSSRRTGDVVAEKANLRIVGWERIPEGGACDWCQLVAEQLYESAESADFGHDRCGCTASPVYAD